MQRKENSKEEKLTASKNTRIAIVVSEFNFDITGKMAVAAEKTLIKAGVLEKNIKTFKAPGGFEIPLICKKVARTKKYSGIIAIGCVIRGDTDHYIHIATESTHGVMEVMLSENISISNAILTVNNLKQAKIRSHGETNKGVEAATALLKMLSMEF